VTEAIPLQATLVFGLLRYYRNDKKPRSPHGTSAVRHTPFAMTNLISLTTTILNLPQVPCPRFLSLLWNLLAILVIANPKRGEAICLLTDGREAQGLSP
jgi:hypothetical protein